MPSIEEIHNRAFNAEIAAEAAAETERIQQELGFDPRDSAEKTAADLADAIRNAVVREPVQYAASLLRPPVIDLDAAEAQAEEDRRTRIAREGRDYVVPPAQQTTPSPAPAKYEEKTLRDALAHGILITPEAQAWLDALDAQRAAAVEEGSELDAYLIEQEKNLRPQIAKSKEKALVDTETALDSRAAYKALRKQYEGIMSQAMERGIVLKDAVERIRATGIRDGDEGYRIRKLNDRIRTMGGWD